MHIFGDSLYVSLIFALFTRGFHSYKISNSISPFKILKNPLSSKHIDDMLFECAIYKDKLTFPSNSTLLENNSTEKSEETESLKNDIESRNSEEESTTKATAKITPTREHVNRRNESEYLLSKITSEVEKDRIKTELIKLKLNRINLPIIGRVTKPQTKYLEKIYYILEENNRSLNENKLLDSSREVAKTRKLVQPRNINKIFKDSSVVKTIKLFPTILSSKSPLLPGQDSTIILQEEHKEYLVREIKDSNIFGIFIGFVKRVLENQKPEIVPTVTLCEFVDISQLDESGKMTVKALERFNVNKVTKITDAVIEAELSLLRDDQVIRNKPNVEENCRIIEKLYDRCNLLESEYRKLDGNTADFEAINCRPKFNEKINKLIEHVDLEKDKNLIYELYSFAGLEFHADLETKIWASNSTDTEQRLLKCWYVTMCRGFARLTVAQDGQGRVPNRKGLAVETGRKKLRKMWNVRVEKRGGGEGKKGEETAKVDRIIAND